LTNLLQNDALLLPALKRPVSGGAYGQSARGWTHSKTLARRSPALIEAKRLGVWQAFRRFNLERNHAVGRPGAGLCNL